MSKFWLRLSIAFVDLALAGILIGRGHTSMGFFLFVVAALLGGWTLFTGASSPPASVRRDYRGRPITPEFPFDKLLAGVGTAAILGAALFVAHATTRPPAPKPRASAATPPATAPAPRTRVPPPAPAPVVRDWARDSASNYLLYKCVDAAGGVSIQSLPCPAGSSTAWIRDATPAREPSRRRESSGGGRGATSGYDPGLSSSSMSARAAKKAACDQARAADAAYRRRPLDTITYDGLERHADRIREACD